VIAAVLRGLDQCREVGQRVRLAERAVRAVRREHLQDGVDVVPGHRRGITREQLLDLDDVGDVRRVHRAPLLCVQAGSGGPSPARC
jgi:predicted methyltransferase MtxX (methanogen marker protein 4)